MYGIVWGNPMYKYILAVAAIAVGFAVVNVIKQVAAKKLRELSKKTTTLIDDFIVDILEKLALPVANILVVFLSLKILAMPPLAEKAVNTVLMACLTFAVARFAYLSTAFAFKQYWIRQGKSDALERSLNGILRVVGFLIWSLAVIFFLDNIGFKVSTVIAGLGIGGVAVALAAQAILQDLFSYFSIIFDRPFEVGDFIIIDSFLGTVEYIGIKTTRIRSLSGEQLIFSNTDLTNSRVRNYKRMQLRRVVFGIGVTYNTPLENLKEIPKIIKGIIENIPDTRFDRAHFASYGDFSLNYEIVYYVLDSDYNKYMDIQQEINFRIKEEFDKRGIEFAFPTQTIYMASAE